MKQTRTIWVSHLESAYKVLFKTGLLSIPLLAMLAMLALNNNAVLAQGSDSRKNEQAGDTTVVSVKVPEYSAMSKSPSGALWRSFVVPGWGQLYNEDYWKAPIFTVAWGVLGYLIYDNHTKYMDIKKITDDMSRDDPAYYGLRQERESYRDNRDLYGLYVLGVYSIAALDAYAGAHLFDFEVTDDLACKFRPTPFGISLFVEF